MKNLLLISILVGLVVMLFGTTVYFYLENEKTIEQYNKRMGTLQKEIDFLQSLIEPSSYELDEDICIGRPC